MRLVNQVPSSTQIEWKKCLVFYQLIIELYKHIQHRNEYISNDIWIIMKKCLLQPGSERIRNKRRKVSLNKETKMRIIGLVCILVLRICMWTLTDKTLQYIINDIELPNKLLIGLMKIIGCKYKNQRISLKAPFKSYTPGTKIDGKWWIK